MSALKQLNKTRSHNKINQHSFQGNFLRSQNFKTQQNFAGHLQIKTHPSKKFQMQDRGTKP